MANTLRFKRGLASGIPTGVAGEPLFTTDTFDLYIGNGTTNTRFQKYIASGTTSQYLRGDGSLATFPSLTGFVPYTGATANVDLGTHTILAQNATIASSGSGNTATITHSSGSGIALNITKGGNGEGLYINKTSGTGNAATIIGTLNATTLVKSGGTSTQYLMADGSTSTLTNPITGTGTTNYLPKFTGATTLGNSLFQEGTNAIGLGATPSAWGVIKAFEMPSSSYIATQGPALYISANGYYNGTNNVYKSNGYSNLYALDSGKNIWYNAPIGSAGANITYTQAMTLDTSGNLLVGANSVLGGGSGRGNITINGSSTSILSLGTASTLSGYIFHSGTNMTISNFKSGALIFATGDIEYSRITTLGNLHIGTFSSDSGEKLQVTGTAKITSGTNQNLSVGISPIVASASTISDYSSLGGNIGISRPEDGLATVNTIFSYNTASNAKNNLAISFRNDLVFVGWQSSTPIVRARLDSSGNFGLGVTPSAWSGFTAFDIGSTGNLASFVSGADVQLNANAYFNGSGWIYKTTNTASRYRMNGNQFEWWNAPSGTAGNAITFTQAMTLTAAGRLLLGTTTESTYLLDVNGTGRFVNASTFQGIFSGWSTSGANSASGAISLGNNAAYRGVISYAADGNTTFTFDNSYDSASAIMRFRMRTAGTAVNALTIAGTGAATFSSSVTAATFIPTSSTAPTNGMYLAAANNLNFATDGLSRFSISPTGAATFTSTINSTSANGLAIGSLTGTQRIQYGSDVATSFTLLTAANAYAGLFVADLRSSTAIAIGTTPDTNNPFKILKNLNTTVGIKFENTNTGSSAFSAIQFGSDISGGTKFANLVYSGGGITPSGVYDQNSTAIINIGAGGLNLFSQSSEIKLFTGAGDGTKRWELGDNGITVYNVTAPASSATDGYRQYSADVVAGNAAPHFRTENGAVIKLYQETTAVGNSTISIGGGSAVLDDTEFGGYTLRQVVKALQNQGILA
jgi:hypothetical protein